MREWFSVKLHQRELFEKKGFSGEDFWLCVCFFSEKILYSRPVADRQKCVRMGGKVVVPTMVDFPSKSTNRGFRAVFQIKAFNLRAPKSIAVFYLVVFLCKAT